MEAGCLLRPYQIQVEGVSSIVSVSVSVAGNVSAKIYYVSTVAACNRGLGNYQTRHGGFREGS